MDNNEIKWLVAVAVIVGILGAAWWFRDELLPSEPLPVIAEPAPAPELPPPSGPEHPMPPPPATSGDPRQQLVPLPPLDESDSYFALALADVFGGGLAELLNRDALVDRFVATVDNLPRSRVPEKIRPIGAVPGAFVASDAGDVTSISPDNYARYEPLVAMFENADLDVLVDTYRRFYPLFQESYENLGYPDGYFNDRAVEVIDHLLAAPQPAASPQLLRPHVLYEYADPGLESLSGGQKLLLRMGPDNAARVKAVLGELRTRIARPPQ